MSEESMSKLNLEIEELEARIAPGVTINPPGLETGIDIGGGAGLNDHAPAPYNVAPANGPAGELGLPAPAVAQVKSGVVLWVEL
jgi:hypothetical protein